MQIHRKGLANVLLVIVSMLCAVVALELIARMLPANSQPPLAGMNLSHFSADRAAVPDPALGYRLKRNYSVSGFRFNRHGFVGEEFDADKPGDVYRIICLGGSTTLGAGCDSDRYTYPALLAQLFAKTTHNPHRRIEVINGGVFGYHSWHTLIRSEKELPAYKPDAYVFMDGLNDVLAACTLMTPQELDSMSQSNLGVLRSLVAPKGSPLGAWFEATASRLALFKLSQRLHDWLQGRVTHAQADYAQRMRLFQFQENLDRLARESLARGIHPLFVNYPWIRSDSPAIAKAMGIPEDKLPVFAFGRGYLDAANRQVAASNNVMRVDPQPLFDAQSSGENQVRRVYSDTIHFTRYGNLLLAISVYKALLQDQSIQAALGRDAAPADDELLALFPDILVWRPTDGDGWPGSAEGPVSTEEVARVGLRTVGTDYEGWTIVSPSETSGVIRFRLSPPPKGMAAFFYPRVGGDGDNCVRVDGLDSQGRKIRLFSLENKTGDGIWSPMSGRYALPFPEAGIRELEITLEGQNAQLWVGKAGWLFGSPPPGNP